MPNQEGNMEDETVFDGMSERGRKEEAKISQRATCCEVISLGEPELPCPDGLVPGESTPP